jgi:pimeloyl-ACP methyl ester carboxylesterase
LDSIRTRVSEAKAATVSVNGAELYHEVRGSGPAILFISGATGDAGHFGRVAELLADEFTVVTYDRRGNSRSPRPAGWDKTSMDEQADGVAGLIQALGLGPAVTFGTSGGAVILLNLLLRHPEVLRGAIVHEPPLVSVLSNAEEVGATLQSITKEGLANAGPRETMEMFIRQNAGDENFENLEPELRERMLGNAETFLLVELEGFVSYVPYAGALAEVKVPVQVMAGIDNRGVYYHEAAEWVAEHLGTDLQEIPGGHTPYFNRPEDLVMAIRPFLRGVSYLQPPARPRQGRRKL